VQALGPHVAPLGMEFYTGPTFPEEYNRSIFIALHGSWNRNDKIGSAHSLPQTTKRKALFSCFLAGSQSCLPIELLIDMHWGAIY
jgi:glucose/arabinose dehydrogenase